jgi:mRNA interferase MazF
MFEFGSIVLARFPFTDLSRHKRRPAIVVSRDNDGRADVIVCFITSRPRTGRDMAPIAATAETGLKTASVVRFDKIATLEKAVITGKIATASPAWLMLNRAVFFGVFGFDPSA